MIFVQYIELVFVKKKNFGYLHTCTQWFPCKTEYNDKLRVDPKNFFKCIDMCILE